LSEKGGEPEGNGLFKTPWESKKQTQEKWRIEGPGEKNPATHAGGKPGSGGGDQRERPGENFAGPRGKTEISKAGRGSQGRRDKKKGDQGDRMMTGQKRGMERRWAGKLGHFTATQPCWVETRTRSPGTGNSLILPWATT